VSICELRYSQADRRLSADRSKMHMKQSIKAFLRRFPLVYRIVYNAYKFFFPGPIHKQIEKTLRQKSSVFFIQIGSNDGVEGDPIHNLITKNAKWAGIFVEPVGSVFQRLKQNYRNAERFTFENVAIAKETGVAQFYYVSEQARAKFGDTLPPWYDQLGSFDRNHILKYLGSKLDPYIVEEKINCVPLQEMLDRNGVTKIDLLHVDTEGSDYDVLSQVNFDKYKPLVVLYEHLHLSIDERTKAKSMLEASGYEVVEYGGDTLAILEGLNEGEAESMSGAGTS
jgi:FkbM family methyltransferase